MKKCPKCGKAYDDSWSVCLECEGEELIDTEQTDKLREAEAAIREKELKGIVKCSDCNKEFHISKLTKKNVMRYGGIETIHVCEKCNAGIGRQTKIVWSIMVVIITVIVVLSIIATKK